MDLGVWCWNKQIILTLGGVMLYLTSRKHDSEDNAVCFFEHWGSVHNEFTPED
jgi:hypothetical protein